MRDEVLTSERLREVVSFDPSTGVFMWRLKGRGIRTGRRVGSVDPKNGYRIIRIDKRDYYAQRLAWFWVHGTWPRLIRFQDGDRDNCRIANLCEGFYLTTKYDHKTKEGRAAFQKEYRATPGVKDRLRGAELQRTFGIDLAEYQRLFVKQKGVCAICKQHERGTRNGKAKWLAVDHCHDTGSVRGLLCSSCNPMLGYAKDNAGTLTRAISYLQHHSAANDHGDNVIVMPEKESA